MSNSGRAFRKALTRLIAAFVAVLAALAVLLCLGLKEFGYRAAFAVDPSVDRPDSIIKSVCPYLRSSAIAKGGALSAMRGDMETLLLRSIADERSRINKTLESFSADSSLWGMRKLCLRTRGNTLVLSYFSYDSLAALSAYGFFRDKAMEKLPKGTGLSEEKVDRLIYIMKARQEAGVKVIVLTVEADNITMGSAAVHKRLLKELTDAGILTEVREEIEECFAVIDDELVWHGGANLLGKEDVWDNLIRVRNPQIAAELLEIAWKTTALYTDSDTE